MSKKECIYIGDINHINPAIATLEIEILNNRIEKMFHLCDAQQTFQIYKLTPPCDASATCSSRSAFFPALWRCIIRA